jgi:hypothetical protein
MNTCRVRWLVKTPTTGNCREQNLLPSEDRSKENRFSNITHQPVSRVEKMINERPLRTSNQQTPNAVFLQKLKVVLIT